MLCAEFCGKITKNSRRDFEALSAVFLLFLIIKYKEFMHWNIQNFCNFKKGIKRYRLVNIRCFNVTDKSGSTINFLCQLLLR